jgi:hypothetical protein
MNSGKKKLLCILGAGVIVVGVFNLFCYRYSSVFDRIGDMSGRTTLHWAAWDGRASAVKRLLAKGTDVNCRSKNGETPLHDAAWRGHKETVELLIANGADVNARDYPNETTPLHLAAFAGQGAIVRVLLAAGADATAKSRRGATPLDYARNTLENGPLERFFHEKRFKACIAALRAHMGDSLSEEQSRQAMGPSATVGSTTQTRGDMATTIVVFLAGMAVAFVGYVWTAVVAFRKDVAWGIGCLFAPINLIFVVQNWDECRAPFVTSMVGLGICLAAFILGPTIDVLMMIA